MNDCPQREAAEEDPHGQAHFPIERDAGKIARTAYVPIAM